MLDFWLKMAYFGLFKKKLFQVVTFYPTFFLTSFQSSAFPPPEFLTLLHFLYTLGFIYKC